MYTSKQLNLVIPNVELSIAQTEALYKAIKYADKFGIEIKIFVTHC